MLGPFLLLWLMYHAILLCLACTDSATFDQLCQFCCLWLFHCADKVVLMDVRLKAQEGRCLGCTGGSANM